MQAPSRSLIFNLTAALEGALLLAAAVWIYFAHIPLLQHMQFSPHACLIGFFVSLGTTAFSVFALTLGKGLPVLRELKKMSDEVLAPMVEILGYFDILFISLVSGFCEEVLFRGVVQAQIGLLPASLFFGLFHDPTLRHKSYVFFTLMAGIVLGYLYQQTGNLWSSISAHIFHNFFALIILRFVVRLKKP
jgi:membrane protease YdiL (CAAX protease family)